MRKSNTKRNTSKPKTNSKKSKNVKTPSKQFLKYPKKIKGGYLCKYCPKKFSFVNNKYSHQKNCIIGKSLGWLRWESVVAYSKKISEAKEIIKKADEAPLNFPKIFNHQASNIFYKNRIPKNIRKELEMSEEDENIDEEDSMN